MIYMQMGPRAMMGVDSKEQVYTMQTGNLEGNEQGFRAQTGKLGLR